MVSTYHPSSYTQPRVAPRRHFEFHDHPHACREGERHSSHLFVHGSRAREYFFLSTSRNSGAWKISLARHDGLFMSEADLQAWKSSGPRAAGERAPPPVLDKNACLYRARDTRTACIKGVIVSSSVFIWRTAQP